MSWRCARHPKRGQVKARFLGGPQSAWVGSSWTIAMIAIIAIIAIVAVVAIVAIIAIIAIIARIAIHVFGFHRVRAA